MSSARGGRRIYGILAPPRLSRNNNLYLPEELARADGLTVPLYLDHEDFEMQPGTKTPTGRILAKEPRGRLHLIWNRVLQRLEYIGEVWDSALQKLIRLGQRPHVSLAAEPRHFDTYRGHNVPIDLQFFSVAAVKDPGIPETTLTMESYLLKEAPVVLESAKNGIRMMILEFETESSALEEEAELDSDDRGDLRGSQFAYIDPDTGDRKLPIHDAPHVRNALARFGQTDFHSDSAKAAAMSKIKKAAKRLGVDVSEDVFGPPIPSVRNQGAPGIQRPVSEPMHPDFQKMKDAMKQQYGDRGDDVYYAFVNKHGLDDTKPYAGTKETEDMLRTIIPQGYDRLTPMRGKANQRSGLPGVTATSNITPMQGTEPLPSGVPDRGAQNRPQVSQTGMDQQILPRDRTTTTDGMMATAHESADANKEDARGEETSTMAGKTREEEEEEQGRGDVSSAMPKKYTSGQGATSDGSLHDVGIKNIGLASTPFEELQAKVAAGTATVSEIAEYAKQVSEKYDARPGTRQNQPNQMTTGGVDNQGRASVKTKEEEMDGKKKTDEEEEEEEEEEVKEAATYGFSKEEFRDFKSTYSKKEWPRAWEMTKGILRTNTKLKEFVRRNRLEMSGVLANRSIGGSRESRDQAVMGPLGGVGNVYGVNQPIVNKDGVPNLSEHVDVIRAVGDKFLARSWVPALRPPPIYRGKGLGPRLEFADTLSDWTENSRQVLSEANAQMGPMRRIVGEAIATTTSGTAMAVDGAVPALIVPTNLAALLRDTVYYQQIAQGSDRVRFQTITVPTAGALTQNVEPAQVSQTLNSIDITPTPRGVEQQVSFEAERKILGPILEGVILAFRVSELYDEDYLLLGSGQVFESGVLSAAPAAAGPFATYNQIFGDGSVTTEATVTSSMVYNLTTMTNVQDQLSLDGYSLDNLVAVIRPEQYRKLLQDSNVNRLISFGPNTTPGQSWVAQGVIPELVGFEIRRSTLGITGTGAASATTYHAWHYKKGLTAGLAASRDLMIETFRDIRVNSTWIKGHWDFAYGLLQNKSLVEVVSG